MKNKCAYRECKEEGKLIWKNKIAYLCNKHYLEYCKIENDKKEAGIK
jgi:hypothetical protein